MEWKSINFMKKLVQIQTDIIFLSKCKQMDIIPKGLKWRAFNRDCAFENEPAFGGNSSFETNTATPLKPVTMQGTEFSHMKWKSINFMKKLVQIQTDIIFLSKCKQMDIIPKGLKAGMQRNLLYDFIYGLNNTLLHSFLRSFLPIWTVINEVVQEDDLNGEQLSRSPNALGKRWVDFEKPVGNPWLKIERQGEEPYGSTGCKEINNPYKKQQCGAIWNTKDWKNLARNLACHEKAANHQRAFHRWKELEMGLRLKATIDDQHQEKIASESLYWQNVLKRLIAIVRVLATQNLALHGTSDQLYVPNNRNFLKIVELMAEFDAVLQDHLRRVTTQEMYTHHFLGKTIQNEITQLLATKVKQKIVADLESARYYFVILDCTSDISRTEQITLMVSFVTTTELSDNVPAMVTVREYFLEFTDIDDITGAGMTNVLLKKLEDTGIAIADTRGQGYDNGANMRGKNRGVQTQI
ncbi:Zinc finger MYM-type protein 1 [Chelonia mydas]|uniref:Zinc finger MYM-type protein 1 n=1 Tax=Chelonia mydas TaxID=8469 RepID=M7AR69_CHEMY|nr:Zinc finger MYM-type protein 1 [Chelonia mydas]